MGRINGQVAMEDVSFAYDERKEVLHNISFRSEPGTVTALVGPSFVDWGNWRAEVNDQPAPVLRTNWRSFYQCQENSGI